MTPEAAIIEIDPWLQSPAGRYLLEWEQAQFDRAVADLFGFHALQLGWGAVDALRTNRMPHRWLACDARTQGGTLQAAAPQLRCDFHALPFPAHSLDLVVLPHTLELAHDAHETLREVERVLVPEGRLVVLGFNPTSLWGLRQRFGHLGARLGHGSLFLPSEGEFIGYWRLRDWLKLLGFHIEAGRFGCYRPALHSQKWLDRLAWMDKTGDRWWPVLGAVYFLVAVKRVQGMRLIGPAWKGARTSAARAPAVVAQRQGSSRRTQAAQPERETV